MLDLIARWREEAEALRHRGLGPHAALIDSMADDLEVYLRGLGDETVNLTDAAELSGYSADWLGQMLREGKIHNAGRKHAPLIRLADLPRKAGCGDGAGAVTVLRLASRRAHGLEAREVGRRVREQGERDAQGQLAESLSAVGG